MKFKNEPKHQVDCMTFNDFPFSETLLDTLEHLKFTQPTATQIQVMPFVLEGLDLRVSAQTGTGKTAAFLLPALEKLSRVQGNKKRPRILILVPTRELAIQVSKEAERFSKNLPIKTVCIYGGTPYPIQIRQLQRPYDILVATPGRLMDHLERKRIDLAQIEMFILDEADRMLDMGFIDDVEKIATFLPTSRQTLLFSATLRGSIFKLSEKLMKNPKEITISAAQQSNPLIDERLYYVDDLTHKYRLLDRLLEDPTMNQTIIFTSTKRFADELMEDLLEKGHNAAALHGDMHQKQRFRTLTQLRKGDIKVLIATDVAARGIDVQSISHVINFDLPQSTEDYVHRIGRTGRAGASGIALSFAGPKDSQLVQRIEKYTGQKIKTCTIAGLEPKERAVKSQRKNPRKPFRSKSFSSRSRR